MIAVVALLALQPSGMEQMTTDTTMSMSMGCGETSCYSTNAFMEENMAMHSDMAVEFTCNHEVDFVRGMIPHHAGALKMCEIVRNASRSNTMDSGDMGGMEGSMEGHGMRGRRLMAGSNMSMSVLDPFISSLCDVIEAGQATEIAEMTSWLASKGFSAKTSCQNAMSPIVSMGMAMGCGNTSCYSTGAFVDENMAMHHEMAIKFTCDPEVDFVRGMIPHHAGAIKMCEIVRTASNSNAMDSGDMGGMDGPMEGHEMRRRRLMAGSNMSMLDPFISALCNAIEAGQAGEIANMTSWLAGKGLTTMAMCPAPTPELGGSSENIVDVVVSGISGLLCIMLASRS